MPLVINLTGSVWFFLLIGKAGMLLFLADGGRKWQEDEGGERLKDFGSVGWGWGFEGSLLSPDDLN